MKCGGFSHVSAEVGGMLRISALPSTPLTLRVEGDVDFSSAQEFLRRVTDYARESSAVVLDLRDVAFFDSKGVGALSDLKRTLGDDLRIIPSAKVRRILEIMGLGDVLIGPQS